MGTAPPLQDPSDTREDSEGVDKPLMKWSRASEPGLAHKAGATTGPGQYPHFHHWENAWHRQGCNAGNGAKLMMGAENQWVGYCWRVLGKHRIKLKIFWGELEMGLNNIWGGLKETTSSH